MTSVVLHAVHLLQTVHRQDVGLAMVGSIDDEVRDALEETIRRLRVRSAWFVDDVETLVLSAPLCQVAMADGSVSARLFARAGEPGLLIVAPVEQTPSVPGSCRSVSLPVGSGPARLAEAMSLAIGQHLPPDDG
jgi:hypothetical protein